MADESFPDFLSSAAARLDRDRFPRKKKYQALQPLIDRNKTQIKIKIRHSFIVNSQLIIGDKYRFLRFQIIVKS